jgi:hypothetical protein
MVFFLDLLTAFLTCQSQRFSMLLYTLTSVSCTTFKPFRHESHSGNMIDARWRLCGCSALKLVDCAERWRRAQGAL